MSAASAGSVTLSVVGDANGAISFVAAAVTLFLYLPQLAKVVREHDLARVSVASWIVALLAAISWAAYGMMIRKVPVYLPNLLLAPCSLLIVLSLASRHARASLDVPALPQDLTDDRASHVVNR